MFPEDGDPPPHVRGFHVFKAVEENYDYSEGTKVAMAVFAKQAANQDSSRMPEDVAKTVTPAQVYGVADEINIYAGNITYNGEHHFQHNMNSYRGCSGAIIFLLEGPFAGFAIGVHVGSPDDVPYRVGLAIKIHELPTLLPRSPPT